MNCNRPAVQIRVLLVSLFGLMSATSAAHADAVFVEAQSITIDASSPLAFVIGDFNADTLPDLATALSSARLHVFYADGFGDYAAPVETQVLTASSIQDIAAGDLNADGRDDLVVMINDPNAVNKWSLRVLLANNGPGFTDIGDYPLSNTNKSVAVADLDNDGLPDVLSTSVFGNGVTVHLNQGAGVLGAPSTYSLSDSPDRGLIVGDVDKDGIPDVAARTSNCCWKVGLGNGSGGLAGFGFLGITGSDGPAAAFAEMDHDGNPDLVLIGEPFNSPMILSANPGDGTGGFLSGPNVTIDSEEHGTPTRALAIADFDLDGHQDAVIATLSTADPFGGQDRLGSNGFRIAYGNGAAGFQPLKVLHETPEPDANLFGVWQTLLASPDLDLDGRPDLVFSEYETGQPSVRRLLVWLNRTPAPLQRVDVITDSNQTGTDELALVRGTDAPVEIRDTDGSLLGNVDFFDANFQILDAAAATGANDISRVAALGLRNNGAIKVQVGNPPDGSILRTFGFLSADFDPVAMAMVPDFSGNGASEVAVLTRKKATGNGVVQIKDIETGALVGAGNISWLNRLFEARDVFALPDVDGNGVAELGVLTVRVTDGRIAVQMKNVSGPPASRLVFFTGPGFVPVRIRLVDDADGNGIPELALLMRRISDGRFLVQRRNAMGKAQPHNAWFLDDGFAPVDMVALPDTDADGNAEYGVLGLRQSDGRFVVERRNAAGAPNARTTWFMNSEFQPLKVIDFQDRDSNGNPEAAVLARRFSDGRYRLESRNLTGTTSPRTVWFQP
jgi:hypothetical protein